ncbi:lanthionine synthetase C family protein [Parasphingorhabdus pacifica]
MNTPKALAAVDELADRLADPQTIYPHGGVGRTRPQSLLGGAAGIALLHLERARCGHGTWDTARAWLSAAARDELSTGHNATLFYGAAALGFLTRSIAGDARRCPPVLATLDEKTIEVTRARLTLAHARLDRGERPALAEYDLFRGLAGFGAYHLRHHPDHNITRAVLRYLVRLTEPLTGSREHMPGWWTEVSPNGEVTAEFPGGHGNIGMSHGIAAPLALLSLALLRGVVVDGHRDAITRICTWLDGWQQTGPWWPGVITRDNVDAGHVAASQRQAPRWCYGTVGLARAQQLAGLALHDPGRTHLAEAAMLSLLRDSTQLDRVTDTGLCHGLAGILQTAWRVAADADTGELAAALPLLCQRLLDQLLPPPNDPEFLDGMAGIALALHTLGTDAPPHSGWDSCLLMA